MTKPLFYLTEGSRIFLTSWKNRLSPKTYQGNAEKICKQIVSDCWNGKFFQTSTTNFPQFWARDFGWCTKSLLELGYKDKVHKTLRYAFNAYQKKKKITTTITPKGRAYDFPYYAADSLPWLIHSIVLSKFDYSNYDHLLNAEIRKFYDIVVDHKTGLVKRSQSFSSMKDFSVRDSSCYDNCMVAMLAVDLCGLRLLNPFPTEKKKHFSKNQVKEYYSKLILKKLWNGRFFYDDMNKLDYVAGDANLFPFLTGLVTSESKFKSAVKYVNHAKLNNPFPLKYTNSRANVKFIPQEFFFKDYESDSIWTHMGPLYIKMLKQIDKDLATDYKERYAKLIEKYQGYPEVLFADGSLYHTPFYNADRAMLWAANYLTL